MEKLSTFTASESDEQKKAPDEIFPTKREKAKKVVKALIESCIDFAVSVLATALGWNVCLCSVFSSLPTLSVWQLILLDLGIGFLLFPVTHTINQHTDQCAKGK